MRSSDFFKKLDKELEALTPPLSEELKDAPLPAALSAVEPEKREKPEKPEKSEKRNARARRPFGRSRLLRIASLAAAFVLVSTIALVVLLGAGRENVYVLALDVNPSVQLVLDDDRKVERVFSANADGDILLSDEEFAADLVEKPAAEAAKLLSDRMAQLGYIDVRGEGTAERYNALSVTLTSSGNAPTVYARELGQELTDYFCSEGIYVYVTASARSDASLKERDFEGEDLLCERIEGEDALLDYARGAAFAFAQDLLEQALFKYDLFVAADEINSRIIEETGNPLGYWSELSEIPAAPDAEMAAALKDIDIYFGLDFSARGVLNAAAFRSAADTCMSGYTDELRALAQAGISASTILGDENRQLRLDYIAFVSADILIDLVEDIFSGSTETIDGLLSGVVSLLASRAEALQKQFSAAFSQAREAISSAAYADFLVRIGVR